MQTSYSTEQRCVRGTDRTTSTRTVQARWRSSWVATSAEGQTSTDRQAEQAPSQWSQSVTAVMRRSSHPTGAGVNRGSSAHAVAARTPATLSSKNCWRADASMSDDTGVLPRPSSLSNDCQSWRGCDCWASMRLDQNADSFWRRRVTYRWRWKR